MAKAKKTEKTANKKLKRRGRPPKEDKIRAKKEEELSIDEFDEIENEDYDNDTDSSDYDEILIKKLKTNRKEREKIVFKEDYEVESEELEDSDDFEIDGYDIEGPGEEEFEESYNVPRKTTRRKRKKSLNELEIESDFYESDYYIGDYE